MTIQIRQLFFLISLLFFAACQDNSQQETINLEGIIGDTMSNIILYQDGEKIYGTLRYKSPINQVFNVQGTLKEGTMRLKELKENTAISVFEGSFNGKYFSGKKTVSDNTPPIAFGFRVEPKTEKEAETKTAIVENKKPSKSKPTTRVKTSEKK